MISVHSLSPDREDFDRMIVMKFGGSSVGDAQRIRTVLDLVRRELPRKPVVVASAHKGVTNLLVKMGERARAGEVDLGELERIHVKIAEDLGVSNEPLKELLSELSILLRGISLVRELSPRSSDYVLSFGERLSCRTLAAFFTKNGLPSEAYDAGDIGLITDDAFGEARPLPEHEERLNRFLADTQPKTGKVPIVTGYIGKTRAGDLSTLGRNGSDYSAAIVGAAIHAEEIQIWTDVDGVMSADPAVVPGAVPIERMSFAEASELAYYGGKVLHPATLIPAVKKGIPVLVLNTFRPESKGTVVMEAGTRYEGVVKSIVYKERQVLINIESSRMLGQSGFLQRIFEVFGRHRVNINMVSTSEVSVSVTTDNPKRLPECEADLKQFADVTVEPGKSIVCVVGEGMRSTPGIPGDIFAAVKEANVNVLMISQGASHINISFVVEDAEVVKVVRSLHDKFFAGRKTPLQKAAGVR
jgi:aspartate kinase